MNRRILKATIVVIVGTVSIAVLVAGISRLQRPYRTPFSGSVHDAGTGGGKAVRRWVEKMGWPVTIVTATLPAVPTLARDTGNCLFSSGNEPFPIADSADSASRWRALRTWVARGNSLFLVTAQPASLPPELFRYVLESAPPVAVSPAPRPPSQESSVVTEEIVVGTGGRLTINALGPRWSRVPGGWETAGDRRGSVYHRIGIGHGAVVIVLDDLALTNSGLDVGSNPDTIAALLDREVTGGVVVVDEARHGHGEADSYLGVLLSVPGARSVMVLCALLVMLFLYGRNVRFGRPEPYAPVERRSSSEYVEALAGLYERARAAPLMVEAVAHRLRTAARRRSRMSAALDRALERATEYRATAPRERVPREALRLMRELTRLRREVLGSQRTEP